MTKSQMKVYQSLPIQARATVDALNNACSEREMNAAFKHARGLPRATLKRIAGLASIHTAAGRKLLGL